MLPDKNVPLAEPVPVNVSVPVVANVPLPERSSQFAEELPPVADCCPTLHEPVNRVLPDCVGPVTLQVPLPKTAAAWLGIAETAKAAKGTIAAAKREPFLAAKLRARLSKSIFPR